LVINIGFDLLSKLIQMELWIFLVGLMSTIFFLMFKKKINIREILFDRGSSQAYNPEKFQLLLLSVIFVVVYLMQVRHNLNECKFSSLSCSLPEVRSEYLFILGGSNFVYLWGKFTSMIKQRRSERA
jgi:hypothetical protein